MEKLKAHLLTILIILGVIFVPCLVGYFSIELIKPDGLYLIWANGLLNLILIFLAGLLYWAIYEEVK